MAGYDHRRAVQVLTALLALAVTVSIVHYTDNAANFGDFPPAPDSVPSSAGLVVAFWFGFTAVGLAGYLLFRRRPSRLALALLAVYSGSGLVGIGHYLVPDAMSMPWWRHAHVVVDIACGIAMLSFAVWAARAPRGYPDGGRGNTGAPRSTR